MNRLNLYSNNDGNTPDPNQRGRHDPGIPIRIPKEDPDANPFWAFNDISDKMADKAGLTPQERRVFDEIIDPEDTMEKFPEARRITHAMMAETLFMTMEQWNETLASIKAKLEAAQ